MDRATDHRALMNKKMTKRQIKATKVMHRSVQVSTDNGLLSPHFTSHHC